MHTQSLDIPGNVIPFDADATSPEQAQFGAVMAAGGKIEPRDWMPKAFRKTLVRQISQHAHSEAVRYRGSSLLSAHRSGGLPIYGNAQVAVA